MQSRMLMLYDPTMPYPGIHPSPDQLARWRQQYRVVDADGLESALAEDRGAFDTVVLLHGGFFPKSAWTALIAFLKHGKGMVVAGGVPFRHPCRRDSSGWEPEPETASYLQELGIHEVLPIADDHTITDWRANPDIPILAMSGNHAERALASRESGHYVLHGSPAPDHPHESGSAGPMDCEIFPLLSGFDQAGRARVASVVLLEHKRGTYAGSRWVFCHRLHDRAFWQDGGAHALDLLAEFSQQSVTDLWMAPNYATYFAHESPTLTLSAELLRHGASATTWAVALECAAADSPETPVWSEATEIVANDDAWFTELPITMPMNPGLYHLRARCTRLVDGTPAEVRILHHGFWGHDPELLKSLPRMQAGTDYFRKNGEPFPIVGTTYMAHDVARKFLFQPNPYVFDQDMQSIAEHGLNFIRTGLWTAWRQAMFIDGRPSEPVLRALDAFLLSANRHGLEVTFTFFSFTPETWEGENPYLDPRSIAAQKRLISAIVQRHRDTTNVEWDLINEPSLFDPAQIFRGPRSRGDRFEAEAYRGWLETRHGDIDHLQRKWSVTPTQLPAFAAARVPSPASIPFDIQDVTINKNGRPWLDYALFTMDMFNRWASDLTATIKHHAPEALVTAGQDEALAGQRPSPFFYESSVDYTTVHSWWLLDQLVWDGIFAKNADKPNLVQETGVMYLEQADGRAKRSESELADLLERKFAYAFATRSAGAVQWIWNTNSYMNSVNESNIGALRPDGTEKPEARVLEAFARFIQGHADWFTEGPLEPVVVVYPYSNDLGHRRLAVEATSRLTRILAYQLKVPFRAVGEYQLEGLKSHPPRLIVVPSAHSFSRAARQQLFDLAKHHPVTIFWTGPINLDEYWTEYDSGLPVAETPSSLHPNELLTIDQHPIGFPFEYRQSVTALHGQRLHPNQPAALHPIALGQGELLWCPLPIELSTNLEGLSRVYQFVLESAQLQDSTVWRVEPESAAVYCRRLRLKNHGALYLLVSEASYTSIVTISDRTDRGSYRVQVPAQRAVLFFATPEGRVDAVYGDSALVQRIPGRS